MDAVMQAKIRAFDEFSSQFKKFQQELRNVEKAQQSTEKQTKQTNKALSELLEVVGEVGALYVFQAALQNVMQTGRQFELMIKQAQAVTGDFTSTLRDMAMVSTGGLMDVHTPTQLAEAYRELGAAGASVNDIIAANGDILEFGIAAMLETEKSAYAVLAAQKSFNIAMEDTARVVDAYTESMNRGALAGQDFQWIMSSAGAVANMAGQQFEQILSVGSAMKDAGIQAQDAGTSIKSALMALMSPSTEAMRVIKDLGINVYDASGNMKQWADIVGEFEQALGPYNEQAKQLILSTIFGTDGIRAMAVSLNKGSGYLAEFTEGLKNADGATEKMASTMADSYDGAIKRVNASLERAKILMFETIASAAMPMLEAINTIIVGFNNLDPAVQKLIVLLVGGAGLALAITAVVRAAQLLGVTMAMVVNPVTGVIAALGVLTSVYLAYSGAQEQAAKTQEETNTKLIGLSQRYDELSQKVSTASKSSTEYKQALAELQKVKNEMAALSPELATGYSREGDVLDIQADKLKDLITNYEELKKQEKEIALIDLADRYRTLEGELSKLEVGTVDYNNVAGQMQIVKDEIARQAPNLFSAYDKEGRAVSVLTGELYKLANGYRAAAVERAQAEIDEVQSKRRQIVGRANQKNVLGIKPITAEDIRNPKYSPQVQAQLDALQKQENEALAEMMRLVSRKPVTPVNINTGGGGGNGYVVPKGGKGGKSEAEKEAEAQIKATRAYIDAVVATLHPFEKANEQAANAVNFLAAKEQVLSRALKDGNSTAYEAIELNKLRTNQLTALAKNQDTVHQKADAERKQLANVEKALKQANNPEVIQLLRDELDRLNKDIANASQEWWRLEEQRLTIIDTIKQEERQRWDDAYQASIDAMRHEVAMARMSSDQQIVYLEKLRNAHKWSQQQMWSMEEELFRLRSQQLDKYLDGMTKAYKDKLDQLDTEQKAKIEKLQDQLDALDEEGKKSDREEAERQHNGRLAELQDQRHYHELRTGKDHQKAIEEIDKEIAETKRQWELQQQEWSREDQRQNLQDQIDEANKAHEQERNELEKHYDRAREISEDGIMEVIAMLAATSPQWMDTGKQLIDQLIAGLESGDFSAVTQQIEDIKRQASPATPVEPSVPGTVGQSQSGTHDSPLYTIGKGQYTMIGDRAAMWSRELANLLGGLPVEWNQATQKVKIGSQWFNPLRNEDGKSFVSIRDVAEKLGYGVGWDQSSGSVKIYRAAQGGLFTKPALTQIAEAGESEVAWPLSKFQPMLNDAVNFAFTSQRDGSIERAADRIIRAIEKKQGDSGIIVQGPLYHSDATYMGDEMTPEITGRQLLRGMQSAARARGRG